MAGQSYSAIPHCVSQRDIKRKSDKTTFHGQKTKSPKMPKYSNFLSFWTDSSEQIVHHCQTAVTVLSVQLRVCTACFSVMHLSE